MNNKEELAEQYRRKAYEVSPIRKRCQYNNEVIDWNNEIIESFKSDWDAATKKTALWFADRYQSNDSYLNANDIEDFRKAIDG